MVKVGLVHLANGGSGGTAIHIGKESSRLNDGSLRTGVIVRFIN